MTANLTDCQIDDQIKALVEWGTHPSGMRPRVHQSGAIGVTSFVMALIPEALVERDVKDLEKN